MWGELRRGKGGGEGHCCDLGSGLRRALVRGTLLAPLDAAADVEQGTQIRRDSPHWRQVQAGSRKSLLIKSSGVPGRGLSLFATKDFDQGRFP